MKILSKGTYYGKRKAESSNGEVMLFEYDYLHPETDWHYHENPYFMYLINGELWDINKKGQTPCPSGSLLLFNWEEPHQNKKHSHQARGFHIEFERRWFDEKKLDVELWEGSKLLKDPRLHQLIAKIYFEFKCDDSFSKISLDLLTLRLCEGVERHELTHDSSRPSWVGNLHDLLHESREVPSLPELSMILGLHPVHLSRAIPKYFDTTLGDYMRQIRLKKSLGLLGNHNHSLTEIAYECGFADQSHYCRTFKRHYHLTPKVYREKFL